jgi:hypothetical protein
MVDEDMLNKQSGTSKNGLIFRNSTEFLLTLGTILWHNLNNEVIR